MSLLKLYELAGRRFSSRATRDTIIKRCAKYTEDQTYFRALEMGGFVVFDEALRFFGFSDDQNQCDIEYWNDRNTWKYAYGDLVGDIWSFGEDVFGNQFVFADRRICWFQNETAELLPLCDTFDEWIELMLNDSSYYSGASLARAWTEANPTEPLNPLYQLSRITPFACDGKFRLENVFRCKAEDNMTFWANFAVHIKDLPEGTGIRFKFVD